MNKQTKLILVPIIIIALMLLYCWVNILIGETIATWKHYVGLIMFALIVFFSVKNKIVIATLSTGVFLFLATFNLLALTPEIKTSWIGIGPITTPPIQLLSLGLFILYVCVNMNSLIDIHLDYKEGKYKRA